MKVNFSAEMFYKKKSDKQKSIVIKFSDGDELKGKIARNSLNLFRIVFYRLRGMEIYTECVTDKKFFLTETISFKKISINSLQIKLFKKIIKETLDYSNCSSKHDHYSPTLNLDKVINISEVLVSKKIKHGIHQVNDGYHGNEYFNISTNSKKDLDLALGMFDY
jgi:hypothetical protein